MNLEDLATNHDYYANGSNYYSNEAGGSYSTWEEFYSEFRDADIDLNLCYRWDINKSDDGIFCMQVVIIGQRKGIYLPFFIERIEEYNMPEIIEYLNKHWKKLHNIWKPISTL